MLLFYWWIRDPVCQLKYSKGTQLQLYYEWWGQARHQMWVGLATFARTT